MNTQSAYDRYCALDRQRADLVACYAAQIRKVARDLLDVTPAHDSARLAVYHAIRDDIYEVANKAEAAATEAMRDQLAAAWDDAKAEEDREGAFWGFSIVGDSNPWTAQNDLR